MTIEYSLIPTANGAAIFFSDNLDRNSSCPSSGARSTASDETDRIEATFEYTLYGCSAGTGRVWVRELPSNDLVASLDIEVNPAPVTTYTPTPTPTPVPSTASISATRTSINVGQSTLVTFDFDVHGNDVAEIIIPDILGGSGCQITRTHNPQQLQGTYYGCSAGTGDIEISLTNSRTQCLRR